MSNPFFDEPVHSGKPENHPEGPHPRRYLSHAEQHGWPEQLICQPFIDTAFIILKRWMRFSCLDFHGKS